MEELAIWHFSAQGWPIASPVAPGTPRSWRFDFTNQSLPAMHQWAGRYDINSAEPVLGIATLWGQVIEDHSNGYQHDGADQGREQQE